MKKRLISLVPFKKVTVSTSLTLDEIVTLFSNSISSKGSVFYPPKIIKKLHGNVSPKGFSVRVADYNRGSLTYLIGKFISDERGTRIEMYLTGINYLLIPLFLCIIPFLFIDLLAIPDDESIVTSVAFLAMAFLFFIGEADQLDFHVSNILEKYII